MYVAVKGGERAIDAAHAWLAEERRGDKGIAALSVAQIRAQLTLAVNRVMAEGSLYDPDLAALIHLCERDKVLVVADAALTGPYRAVTVIQETT
jgi:alpha-D-ribose 1-methylphosphonate 5-triphosphate synthase subunit PhnI